MSSSARPRRRAQMAASAASRSCPVMAAMRTRAAFLISDLAALATALRCSSVNGDGTSGSNGDRGGPACQASARAGLETGLHRIGETTQGRVHLFFEIANLVEFVRDAKRGQERNGQRGDPALLPLADLPHLVVHVGREALHIRFVLVGADMNALAGDLEVELFHSARPPEVSPASPSGDSDRRSTRRMMASIFFRVSARSDLKRKFWDLSFSISSRLLASAAASWAARVEDCPCCATSRRTPSSRRCKALFPIELGPSCHTQLGVGSLGSAHLR